MLLPGGPRTGGGIGVETVAIDTSPMILSASLQAWYILRVSSRLMASSALSSIIDCCKSKQASLQLALKSCIKQKHIV